MIVAKTIREEIVWRLAHGYALLPQTEKRQFGGSAPGKGRRMSVAREMAAKLAARIEYAMIASGATGPVAVAEISEVIERSLLGISPADAYRTLERSVDQPEKARLAVSEKIADDLLATFEIEIKPRTGLDTIPSMENGPGVPRKG